MSTCDRTRLRTVE